MLLGTPLEYPVLPSVMEILQLGSVGLASSCSPAVHGWGSIKVGQLKVLDMGLDGI